MNKRDKFLGLGNKITRRDFMQGVAGFSASLAVSKAFGEKSNWLADETDYKIYPPGLTDYAEITLAPLVMHSLRGMETNLGLKQKQIPTSTTT